MRKFKGLIFLGNGLYSRLKVEELHDRIEEAVIHSSGMQQGGDEPDGKWQKEIEDIVRDVAAALAGREIIFGDKTPYPWKED